MGDEAGRGMSAGGKLRPLYFMVPFWGRRYREYFVDLCLPSLLAPNNLPLLRAEDGHRFLMATTREDWEAIEGLPIMERLRAHATPTWIEVELGTQSPMKVNGQEDSNQYASAINHQTLCQKKLVEAAHGAKAYGSLIFPDLIYSDGMVAALLKYAREGHHLVLCSSLRQKEEAVLEDLRARGLLPAAERLSLTAQALTISPRLMADLFVRHLHPEVSIYEEDNVPLFQYSPFRFWRVPGGRGLILHTFFGVPVLMDYAVVADDHTACLEQNAFENVYVSTNFRDPRKIHVVQDADIFGWVSLTPTAVDFSVPREEFNHPKWVRKYVQLCKIRESMWFYAYRNRDVLKRHLFRLPMRWNIADLDQVWAKEEQRVGRLVWLAVGDYYRVSRPPHFDRFPSGIRFDPRLLLVSDSVRSEMKRRADAGRALLVRARSDLIMLIDPWRRRGLNLISVVGVMIRRTGLLVCGDRAAVKWWGWRVRKLMSGLTGQRFEEPRPPAPE